MAIDLSKFLQLYFEENTAFLDTLEKQLQLLTEPQFDACNLGLAVRAAHSIKGSSGAFGFVEIAELAMALELALPRLAPCVGRSHRLILCTEAVAGLRQLLQRRQQGLIADAELATEMSRRLAEDPAEGSAVGA